MVEKDAEEATALSAAKRISRPAKSACLRFFLNATLKKILALPNPIHDQIVRAIRELSKNPRPPGCRKLVGEENDWRIRIRDYRVVYEIADGDRIVRINRVRHRKEVYR